jgi:dolichol-phosphate mannosyltransferase
MKTISIIVPTYNQSAGIYEFYRRLKVVLNSLHNIYCYEIIFINDFSIDDTLLSLYELADGDNNVKVISFSRNFGNQIAIAAGIDACKGDAAIIIDDDLQDPPELIPSLIQKWSEGYEVVYGYRPKRHGINIFFNLTTKAYYFLISKLSEVEIPRDTGDFRLIDKKVIDVLRKIKESGRYYRGIISWVGFKQFPFQYERDARYSGKSNFTFRKYVSFGINGLSSFTDKPLYFSSIIGALITVISFIGMLVLIGLKIIDPSIALRGWTSLAILILFFGGVQLLSIGILGIYIGKIYHEVKNRPLYIIDSTKNL